MRRHKTRNPQFHYTVKPVLSGHPWGLGNAVAVVSA